MLSERRPSRASGSIKPRCRAQAFNQPPPRESTSQVLRTPKAADAVQRRSARVSSRIHRDPEIIQSSPCGSQHARPAEPLPNFEPRTETIMAIDLRHAHNMGCAFFESDRGALFVCNDVPMAELDVAEQLLAQIQPTTVLVPGRAPEHLLSFLEERSLVERDDGSLYSNFIIRATSTSEFSLRTAHDKLIALQHDNLLALEISHPDSEEGQLDSLMDNNLGVAVGSETRNMRLMRCGTSLDLGSQVSVSCAGAVLSEINRRYSEEYLPAENEVCQKFEVTSLDMFSLDHYMYIAQETLSALQIIQSEQHPNCQISAGVQSASGSKESLSVYGLFHHLTGTPQGRASLRRLFLRPTQDIQEITERQNFISLFTRPENLERMTQAAKILRNIGNVRRVLDQLRKGAQAPSPGQSNTRGAWAMLRRFAAYVLKIRCEIISVRGYTELPLLVQMVDCINPDIMHSVGNMIESTFDFEDSRQRQRSCVRTGVDKQLDEMKRLYDGMGHLLTLVVDRLRTNIPEWAREYVKSCIFLPQLGFLTVVELDPLTGNGMFEGEGAVTGPWDKMFTSDGVVCYKNKFMKDLDEQYGDMYCEIGDREVEIIHNLATQILEHEEMLTVVSDLCGQFDALLALAIGAEKYNWARPHITMEDGIQIENGRHPLQELLVSCFIPNNCYITESQDTEAQVAARPRALVLTGPNHSGKSIYLKQTAIIVYLAHIGSYVPAERAILGVTDKILARLSTTESVSRVESAFAIDMKQIAQALKGATARSLVLIDEFGKGTSSDDGAGLLTALVDNFLGRRGECPKMLLATHFHEVLEGGYLGHQSRLQVTHMEIEIDRESNDTGDHWTYLFKLAPGHSSSSFGGRCAALNGVPEAVVQRAEAIASLTANQVDLAMVCSQLSAQEEEELKRAEVVARRFLEIDLELETPQAGFTSSPNSHLEAILAQVPGESDVESQY